MNKTHTAAIALLLAASVVLGMTAATRTAGLGRGASARPTASTAAFAARTHRLNRIEVALRRSLRRRPPKLPPVPAVHPPAPVQVAAARPVTAAPQRVVYQRPPPIVVVKHRSHGDDHESGDGGGGGDD
jgi:hypothetical protein